MRARSEALQAFYRVLGPGGRISMFEPVNVLMCDPDRLRGYDITPVKLLADKLGALYESVRPPGVNPMLDFDERDLVRHAEQAGFADIDLQLRVMKNDPGHRS
jgi:arsenite methyltransferase